SRTNADHRLAPDASAQRSRRLLERRGLPDVRTQSSVSYPFSDLCELSAIGHDDEVDGAPAGRERFGRPRDGYQDPARADQSRGPSADAAAEDVEDEIQL